MLEEVQKAVKSSRNRKQVYATLGLTKEHKTVLKDELDEWLGEPCHSIWRASREVLRGKPRTKLGKALLVEREIARLKLASKTIRLYRGVDGEYAKTIFRKIKAGKKKIMVPLRGADSWTDDKSQASQFGDLIIKYDCPVEYIVVCYRSNKKLKEMNESEYIVAHPKKKVTLPVKNFELDEDGYTFKSWNPETKQFDKQWYNY